MAAEEKKFVADKDVKVAASQVEPEVKMQGVTVEKVPTPMAFAGALQAIANQMMKIDADLPGDQYKIAARKIEDSLVYVKDMK